MGTQIEQSSSKSSAALARTRLFYLHGSGPLQPAVQIEQSNSKSTAAAVLIEQSSTGEFRLSVPAALALQIEHFKSKIYSRWTF